MTNCELPTWFDVAVMVFFVILAFVTPTLIALAGWAGIRFAMYLEERQERREEMPL